MSNPNQFPNPNDIPNTPGSYTNLIMFGTPNTPGSSSSPIRNPHPQQYPNIFPQQQPLSFEQQQYLFQQQLFQQQFFQQQQLPFSQPQTQSCQQQQLSPQTQSSQQNVECGSSKKRSHHSKNKGKEVAKTCNKKLWSFKEQAWLAECWIDASEDSRKGNSQKRATLWSTIYEKFNANNSGWFRGDDQLTSKWRTINKTCNEFNAIYNEEQRNWHSGQGDEDIYEAALKSYKNLYLKDFKLKDCWLVLKDKPKWYAPPPVGGDYNDSFDDDFTIPQVNLDDDYNELFGDDPIQRPPGREQAKKAARNSASSDAATSSRSTSSSKIDEFIENMSNYKSEMIDVRKKAVENLKEQENIRTAFAGVQILTVNTSNIENPRDVKRINRMKSFVRRKFKDYIEISDDDDDNDE